MPPRLIAGFDRVTRARHSSAAAPIAGLILLAMIIGTEVHNRAWARARFGDQPQIHLPLFRRRMIPAFSLFASVFLGRRFSDITCGLRAYTLAVARDSAIDLNQPWLDQYELEYYLHYKVVRTQRYRIVEVPVTMRYTQLAPGRQSDPFCFWP